MISITKLEIPDVLLIETKRFSDDRGFFTETYNQLRFREHGVTADFVQDNLSRSAQPGTIRGLHFQAPPRAQAKLVRVSRGAVVDVAVDMRRSSPTFGRHVSVELDSASGRQVFIPEGFLHGFCTVTPDVEVVYKASDYYDPDLDHSVAWNDPDLDIKWPVGTDEAVLSDRDRAGLRWRDLGAYF